MKYRTFLTFNVIGGIAWGAGVTCLGYQLGQFDVIKNNVETIFIGIVLISVIPVIFEVLKARKNKAKAAAQAPAAPYGAPEDPQAPGQRGRHAKR